MIKLILEKVNNVMPRLKFNAENWLYKMVLIF